MSRPRAQALLRRGGERVAGFDRSRVAHAAIVRAIPVVIPRRFDAAAATGLSAVFELRIRDPDGRDPARFELSVSPVGCVVRPGAARAPGATATLGADDLIRLASGAAGWPHLLESGRLQLTGDPFLAIRFPLLFRLPARAPDSGARLSGPPLPNR